MSVLERLWTKTARIAKFLEGWDDPTGDYIYFLEKRVDKVERDLERFESQLRSRPDGGEIRT